MSLTEFVGEAAIREQMDEEFPNGGEPAKSQLTADWLTKNYTLVGTAYDYLCRFWLRRNVDEVVTEPWVAEDGLQVAEILYPESTGDIQDVIDRVEQLRDEFLETGTLTRDLVEGAIDLARIDFVYRAKVPPEDLGEYDDNDVIDCIRLVELLEEQEAFKTASFATLNPTFGLASRVVGGADADAIIDGTLVDVKATRQATFKVDYWRQLVGYLVLADAHRTLGESGVYDDLGLEGEAERARQFPSIDSFGVYYARHGELSTVPSSVIYDADNYPEFRSWFINEALDMYAPFDSPVDTAIRTLF